MERQFQAVCRWTAEKKDIELFEKIRAIIPLRETLGKVWYGTIQEADEFSQEFWDKPHGKRFVPSYLYPGNLLEVLKAGGLEHSGMDILANADMKFNVNIYIMERRINIRLVQQQSQLLLCLLRTEIIKK